MNSLYLRYKSIAVFHKTAAELAPLAELIVCTDVARRVELAACVFRAAAERGCDCTGEWIKSIVMSDDNVFSRAAARGERVSDRLKAQVKSELLTFKQMSLIKPDDFITDESRDCFPKFGFGGFSVGYEKLLSFYAVNGCGRIAAATRSCCATARLSRRNVKTCDCQT